MKTVKKSIIPLACVAAMWLGHALNGGLSSVGGIIRCAVLSAIAFAVLRIFFPDKLVDAQKEPQPAQKKAVPQPEPEKKAAPEPQPAPAAEKSAAKTELEEVLQQGRESIAEIRRLNDEIPDFKISAQLKQPEILTEKIFAFVEQHPEDVRQIRQFLNFYLPTTIKLLQQYVVLQNQEMRMGNIDEGMQKIENMLENVIVAFQKQLDSLFESDVVDITADIQVMEQLMAAEGLTGDPGRTLKKERNQMEEEKIPQLTLTPNLGEQALTTEKKEETPAPEAGPDMSMLSEAEQKAVRAFAEQIDLTDANQVIQYGAAAQKNIADFSESALEKVKTKDMGELGDMVASLLVELKTCDEPEKKKGLAGLFQKAEISAETMRAKYAVAEVNVDRISGELEKHQVKLMKDVAVMDQMYEKNLGYFKELTMYILAGKQKLEQERATTLVTLREKAQRSGLPEDAQAANDFENKCIRFEKKLHDLELTRVISLQTAPQIRMIQNNDALMIEKIQTSIMNTIPLWKNQLVLTLGIQNSKRALEAQRKVTDMTNQLLQKNAEMLKMATVETARESERGIVDIETLQHTNESLISTLDEVLTIQTEGAQKRREAEEQLRRIEGELKQKLLEARRA